MKRLSAVLTSVPEIIELLPKPARVRVGMNYEILRVQYAMSRGALQGGRELRLRVRHKKPKRLLRSWYNLLGHEHSGANGSDVEEVRNAN